MELEDLIKTTMDDAAGPLGLRDGLVADARLRAGRRSRRRTAGTAAGVTAAMGAAAVALVALPRDGDGGPSQVLVPLASATAAPSPAASAAGYSFAGVDFATLPDGFSRCAGAAGSADQYQVTVPRLPEGGTLAALRFGADSCAAGTPQLVLVVIQHGGTPVPVPLPPSNATAGQTVTDADRTLGPYALSAIGADVPQAALDEVLAGASPS